MFKQESEALENKFEANETLVIENMYNEEFRVWEVSMQGQSMGNFSTEEEGSEFAASIHTAFEMGYTNGLLLGFDDKQKAKEALELRGVSFSKFIKFED